MAKRKQKREFTPGVEYAVVTCFKRDGTHFINHNGLPDVQARVCVDVGLGGIRKPRHGTVPMVRSYEARDRTFHVEYVKQDNVWGLWSDYQKVRDEADALLAQRRERRQTQTVVLQEHIRLMYSTREIRFNDESGRFEVSIPTMASLVGVPVPEGE